MKKTLAIILALALVFSSFTVAFAEETLPVDAQSAKTLGMIVGGGNGVTLDYLKTTPDRTQAAAMFLRLKGLYDTAMAFTGTDNFADANQSTWAKPMMAYLKANPQLGFEGVGNNNFNPTGKMDAKSYYKVMLTALGYKQTVGTTVVGDFTWENLTTFAAGINLKAVASVTNFTVNDLATATIETLKTNAKGATKTLAASLVEAKVITLEKAVAAGVVPAAVELAVSSVTANTAKSFVVKFNKAVADTTKFTATTTRGSIAVSLTSTWNTEKTELTLASSSKLVEDTYKIVVKNDATEMKVAEVKIEQEKVAKIEFLSDTLVRANDWYGYVPVKVTNQYGEDITNAPLASGVTFTGGDAANLVRNTNKVEVRKGDANGQKNSYQLTDLRYMTMVVVTAFDSNSATFASRTMKVSDTVGGIAEITFKGLVDKSGNAVTMTQTTTDKVFLSYEAKDAFGNVVDDYATLSNINVISFFSSNSNIAKLTVEKNAVNSTKADIIVTVQDTTGNWVIDMPVVFTAVAYTGGKSATFSTTIARKAALGTFLVSAPTTQVAEGETVVIPYTAYDQAGREMKSWADLQGAVANVSVSGPYTVIKSEERAANGDYMLKLTFPTIAKGKYFVSAVVPTTGKMSQFNVDVRETAKPAALASIDSVFYPYYAPEATQSKDFGMDAGGLANLVKDQYDRNFDLSYQTKYALIATSDNANVITVNSNAISQNTKLVATATAGETTLGTATITVKLVDTTDNNRVIDERSTRITKIKVGDIVSYEILPIATLYGTGHSTYFDGKDALNATTQYVTTIGKTSGGAKVRLPGSMVVAKTTSDARFAIASNGKIYAKNLGTNVTEATAKVYASVLANGVLNTASLDVKATSASPVAEDIYLTTYGVYNATVVPNSSLSTISMSKTMFDAMVGTDIYQFDALGNYAANAYPYFYLEITDNYGDWGLLPAYTTITKLTGTGTAKFDVNKADGRVTLGDIDPVTAGVQTGVTALNDQYQIQSVSNNGLVTTWKIVLTSN
jgi:hypothetical protein